MGRKMMPFEDDVDLVGPDMGGDDPPENAADEFAFCPFTFQGTGWPIGWSRDFKERSTTSKTE